MKQIRYYAIGHSYLLHGPFEGWQTEGFWGMAASEPSKDYFHKFREKLSENLSCEIKAIAENHADFERLCTSDANREKYISSAPYLHMKEVIECFKPNLITVFIGDGNTVAKDEKSLTLFFEVLYEMIAKYKCEDTVVVCAGMNSKFSYAKPVAQSYGFNIADCSIIHKDSSRENPYHAFEVYPEYDELASAGAVEFRTHPSDLGHGLIAEKLYCAVKEEIEKKIADGEFCESYEYEKYAVTYKIPKFEISVSPKFLVRINGFNVRGKAGEVSFSSAPGTGASVMGTGLHILPKYKKFSITMNIESPQKDIELILTLCSKSGEHKYSRSIVQGEMHKYEFDISDICEMITTMKVSPNTGECLVRLSKVEFSED